MKRLILTISLILGCLSLGYSQDIADNAIGLRLGDSDGFGAEISYQRALGSNNRLEADLGWRSGNDYDGFKLTGIYHWVWYLENNFNWYAGPGGGFGVYDYNHDHDHNHGHDHDSDSFVFIAGDIGIEYNFNIPLLLSLDFRPEINFGRDDDLDLDIALGVRYQF
ncbi:hypothetical protein [Mangrovimonas aestuarii]|uniref:hypothetical protein n=1 Tax=Mangrovimonas aestuarii TaxID=3018443 RepID=UPI002378F443|nr:hypothetical protein [Mangrovimonas aestuarii]